MDDILHSVKVSGEVLEKPWMAPVYDEPEFVVQNIWRLYGGWYDGNPARLKPASDRAVAVEVARLAGGQALLQSGLCRSWTVIFGLLAIWWNWPVKQNLTTLVSTRCARRSISTGDLVRPH